MNEVAFQPKKTQTILLFVYILFLAWLKVEVRVNVCITVNVCLQTILIRI
jgi:hypothetical protein